MHGLPEGELWVVDADPAWPALFGRERDQILAALPSDVDVDIAHVGSTSVPGLCAKPIIDIAMRIPRFADSATLVGPLESLGYVHRGAYGIPERRYFVKGEPRTFQIHMLPRTHQSLRDMLCFRDALRASPELRDAYARLKREILARVGNDKRRYQAEKASFITDAVRAQTTSGLDVGG